MQLKISDTLSLPVDAATQTFAFIARKGAGKLSRKWTRVPTAITFVAAIVSLLLLCGPTAVARFVITIVIWKSIKGMKIGWPLAHVCQEVFKAIQPAGADGDSSSSIVRVVATVLVVTPIFHATPCLVLTGFRQAVRTICCRGFGGLSTSASIRFAAQMILPNDGLLSAVTMAQPSAVSWADSLNFCDNNESSESSISQIPGWFHAGIIPQNRLLVGANL